MYKNYLQDKKLLNDEQLTEVAKFIAQFKTYKQAQRFVKEKFSLVFDYRGIEKLFTQEGRWKTALAQLKQEYVNSTMEVPISHKRVRLERYEWLYEQAVASGKFPAAKACLDSAREETEAGKIPSIGSLVFAQINNMSDEELHSEKDRLLEKLEKLGHKPREAVIEAHKESNNE